MLQEQRGGLHINKSSGDKDPIDLGTEARAKPRVTKPLRLHHAVGCGRIDHHTEHAATSTSSDGQPRAEKLDAQNARRLITLAAAMAGGEAADSGVAKYNAKYDADDGLRTQHGQLLAS